MGIIDEYLQRAKQQLAECGDNEGRKKMIYAIFPELNKNRDEEIRSFLIRKMHEVGEVWNEYSTKDIIAWLEKQKSAEWSEEDKSILFGIIDFCENRTGRLPQTLDKYANWLNSLKPQNHWKPTEEQLRDLKLIASQNAANMLGNNLINLYNDLQKL